MKIIILIALVLAAFIVPDDSVSVRINVKPSKTKPKTQNSKHRDTLPHVEMSVIPAPVVHQSTRLTYDFHTIDGGVVVRNVRWFDHFTDVRKKKFTARINRVDQDGYVLQTLYAGELKCELMNVIIMNYGHYKIAVFQVGDYCNGIEYDFRYFGRDNMTPISEFSHHSIPCQ